MSEFFAAIAFFLTALLGPGMFYLYSRKSQNVKKYPTGVVDGIGDLLFLPFFNSLLVLYGLDLTYWVSAIIPALVLSLGYFYYRRDSVKENDWSRPRIHEYNAGGYYHMTYFFIQSFLVFLGLIQYIDQAMFWVPVLLYVLSVAYNYHLQLAKTHK